jgi:hypothetical protein
MIELEEDDFFDEEEVIDIETASIQELKRYIERLEKRIAAYEGDGFKAMYNALNYQLNCLSRSIREKDITLSSNKDDKRFDRFVKLQEVLRKITENVEWLGIKTGAIQEDKNEKVLKNPMEIRANEKANRRGTNTA